MPAVHLSRPAPWHSYSPSELRDAHVRYAAIRHQWESPSPTFKHALRLLPPQGSHGSVYHSQRWRAIRGTRWAWAPQHSTGEVSFCDLRSGIVIGNWSAGGSVIDVFIESRSPNEYILCHWKCNHADNPGEYVPVLEYMSQLLRHWIRPGSKLWRLW